MKLLSDLQQILKLNAILKEIANAPHDTAVAREALSRTLTGRVLPDPPKDKDEKKPDAKQ